jgi:hypothetical protein
MKHNRMFPVWMERVQGDEIAEAHIAQFKNRIFIQAHNGQSTGGYGMKLTDAEARQIATTFKRRVAVDGGPLVTAEQCEKGRTYLARYAKRLGLRTDVDYTAITHFRFAGVHVVDENQWRTITAPVYVAYWDDGLELRYWCGPWTARMSDKTIPGIGFKYRQRSMT